MRYPYKEVGTAFDRTFRNIINDNFKNAGLDIEDFDKRVNNIVASAGDSNTEIVDARGEYPVLRDRLEATSSELAQNQSEITSTKHKGLRTQQASLQNFVNKIINYRDDLQETIEIIGFGSSVGNGASLSDPSTQAPSAYFTSKLYDTFNSLNNMVFQHYNYSEDGTAASRADDVYSQIKTDGRIPSLVTMAYGMNDGFSAQYHAGQAYSSIVRRFKEALIPMRKDGVDAVLFTTPHPHTERATWGMPSGISVIYPYYDVMIPNDTKEQSIISIDPFGTGETLNVSYRHFRVNQAIRKAGAELGVPVIDVEKYWFEAVLEHGEDALYDDGQYAHPNLLGHQLSYHKAIDDFIESLAVAYQHSTPVPVFNGNVGINQPTPTANLHVKSLTGDTPVKVESSTGTEIVTVKDDGTLETTAFRTKNGSEIMDRYRYNRPIDDQTIITVKDRAAGVLLIQCDQSGVTNIMSKVIHFNGNRTNIQMDEISTLGDTTMLSVTTNGMDIILTTLRDGVSIRYSIRGMDNLLL